MIDRVRRPSRSAAWIAVICFLFVLLCPSPVSAKSESAADSIIVVNKSTNELAYFKDGELVRIFPVATGKSEELTPEGVFPIVNKIKNRPYYKEKIPGGDPDNPLGKRWLGLRVGSTEGTTYAIHGNNNERSVGKYVSAGCIRMHNDDIEWLFEQIEIGTKVVIASSKSSFEQLAAANGYALLTPSPAALIVGGAAAEPRQPMYVYRGVTFVSIRTCFELLGGAVDWDADRGVVSASVGERTIVHRPGAAEALVDGRSLPLGAASRNRNGTVFVPLRDIAALSGWTVHWDAASRTIAIEPPT